MRSRRVLSAAVFTAIVLSACSSSGGNGAASASTETAGTAAPVSEGAASVDTSSAATAAPGSSAAAVDPLTALDTNGDGKVVFGIAAAGPSDDGAYYQAVVDAAKDLSTKNGFAEPIVADDIAAADAATRIGDLAQQGVDVIIVGASEIADPLPDLIAKYPDVFWYCNCGSGFPETPGLAQSHDDGGEISYTAGYATGLKLQEKGGDSVVFIGCCDLGFEKQSYMAFELGLKAVDPAYTMTYVPSGDFPYDFDNIANATAALQTAIDNGADAVYPFLGKAHRPVVQAADEAGLITMSAGSSKVCDSGEELKYDIAVQFDGGDYVKAIMTGIVDGTFHEGDIKTFHVGVDPEPGARICSPTGDEQAKMDDIFAKVAAGDFAGPLGEIAGKAYANG